jgi:hypothetical protein
MSQGRHATPVNLAKKEREKLLSLIDREFEYVRHGTQALIAAQGLLQADGFSGFQELYRHGRIQEIACMAHARRKIHNLYAVRPTMLTEEALRRIGALYAIEEQIRCKPPDERRHCRAGIKRGRSWSPQLHVRWLRQRG